MRTSESFVVVANTEYHRCNRIVNGKFKCGLKKFTQSEVILNSHFILSQEQYIKQDYEGRNMAKNKTYTGGRQSIGRPTLNREMYFQLIRVCRKGERDAKDKARCGSAARPSD